MFSLISYSEKCGKSEFHIYLTECVNKTPVGTVLVGGALIHRVKWAKHATYASYICPHKVWKQLHCCFYGYDQGPSIKVFTPIMTDLAAAPESQLSLCDVNASSHPKIHVELTYAPAVRMD